MRIIELSNGVKMPIIGFGTIGQFGKQVEDNVSFALQNGYRLIDTANRYTRQPLRNQLQPVIIHGV